MSESSDYLNKPSESDCCGSGCIPCVFDVYEQLQSSEFQRYNSKLSNIRYDLLTPVAYKPFRVLNISVCTSNTYLYQFQPVEYNANNCGSAKMKDILPYQPGNHVKITTCNFNSINERNKLISFVDFKHRNIDTVLSRDFTPISLSDKQDMCIIDIIIKLYSNGKMSNFISNLKCGDIVYIRGPFGDFVYHPETYKTIYMICGGTGIAPMYGLIQTIVDSDKDDTLVRLYYSCSRINDVLLRKELRNYSRYWNFDATIYLSQEPGSKLDKYHDEHIICGRITSLVIENLIQDKRNSLTLICGSECFNNDMYNFVINCGLSSNQIYVFK